MKYIELRRHSTRIKPSQHLTQDGVNLARKTGEYLGVFVKVYSSSAPRAIETAVAMGFAIDDILDEVSMTPKKIENEVVWGMTFEQYSNIINKGRKTSEYAKELATFLLELIEDVHEEGSILIVSHGGLIEIAAIGCMPDLDYSKWGEPLDICEGVRLTIDKKKFVSAEILRIEDK
ncbi:MAG: histidine phosphatase family protein [Candidatus Heimdallarchaeota archaeon]|nr:histidine phosphatase family protein [Candidatus Heimdallarchaeota archaeon]